MAHMQREELRSLARASRLTIAAEAEDRVIKEIDEVLTYTELLDRALGGHSAQMSTAAVPQALLVVRPDEVLPTSVAPLLAVAPAHEAGYYVVPVVIAHEK